eukprot:gene4009-biopygen3942
MQTSPSRGGGSGGKLARRWTPRGDSDCCSSSYVLLRGTSSGLTLGWSNVRDFRTFRLSSLRGSLDLGDPGLLHVDAIDMTEDCRSRVISHSPPVGLSSPAVDPPRGEASGDVMKRRRFGSLGDAEGSGRGGILIDSSFIPGRPGGRRMVPEPADGSE